MSIRCTALLLSQGDACDTMVMDEAPKPLGTDSKSTRYHPPEKRSVTIAGHRTSISLEPIFWDMLRDAAAREGCAINALVARIDEERIRAETPPGLASAIRAWLVSERFERSANEA